MARKINVKLILELRDAHLSLNQIASTRHFSKHSVSEVFRIADERGISSKDVRELGDNDAYRLFYPDKYAVESLYKDPDYPYIHKELKKTGVTLKLLWEEYRDKCGEDNLAMGYTKYCEGYRQYTIEENLTNHIDHKPGERVEVDWSGPTMHYCDRSTGEQITAYLFVGTLPYSQYAYVEPCHDMKMDTFLRCHVHMFEYFGCVPTRIICDNLKAGVVKHPKEGDIVLTDEYEALGLHYLAAIMPAGVKRPRQKASVEGTVGKIATAIIASLRNREFYSLSAIKAAVLEKLTAFNNAPFEKREGSRSDVFKEEKPYLHELPALPYEIAAWVYDRMVNLDFHVVYNTNRYSCPYQYKGKKVDLRITDTSVEIFYRGERLTTHNRFPDYKKYQYSTHGEDMPLRFQNITQWDDERIRNWAASIGPFTSQVICRIFDSVAIKEQGYNPALSVLRLSRTYTDARLETACELAITRGIKTPRYHHLKAILSANQDKLYLERKADPAPEDTSRGHLRGAGYYRNKGGLGDAE